MPIYVESSILELDSIYLNGGRRGYLVSLAPSVLMSLLGARPVQCASLE
jgi:prolyl-tRNA editing enzyme YbaK/EbsC (Cys-tRNA(Pro) deacylase)